MLSESTVRTALKYIVSPDVYSRGFQYFRGGAVREWSATDEDDGISLISGVVSGGEEYDVTIDFDRIAGEISDISCTCPYEDTCKHVVALGLVFGESLRAKKPRPRKNPVKPLDPQNYFIALNGLTLAPAFHEKRTPWTTASPKNVMDRFLLTPAQHDLLTLIREGKYFYNPSASPDPATLFPLLVDSGIPVFRQALWSYGKESAVSINLNPPPLRAGLFYERLPLPGNPSRVRHGFFLRLYNDGKNKDRQWAERPFHIIHSSLVWEPDESSFDLHPVTPLLARVLRGLQPVYPERGLSTDRLEYWEARLDGDAIEHYESVAADAARVFSLTSPPPPLVSRPACKKPHPAIGVDFDHDAQHLRVFPVVDYGNYHLDLSEAYYRPSNRYRQQAIRRRTLVDHPGSHVITVAGNTILHARFNGRIETQAYRSFAANADTLGLTNTLTCRRKGASSIALYLDTIWPQVTRFAKDQRYPIVFTRDILPTESRVVRADFTTDLSMENDWLYFDVSCYCGDEQITLEKLLAYIERGERFWRTNDGKLVEIANRAELERLAHMVRSFQAREQGGFEGKLHGIAELEYVMTSSPHYNAVRAESFSQFLRSVRRGKPVQPVRLEEGLAAVARPYQHAGVEWLYFLRSFRFGGILADEMGLGKTLQTLAVLSMERRPGIPSLVVCPKTLLYNWKAEANRFTPHLKVLVYDGTPRERFTLSRQFGSHDLVVVSYDIVKRDKTLFLRPGTRFNYAVLDEAQFIKNHATKNAQVVKQLNADYRLVLTGTPLENSVAELWSLFDFLMPGFLGSFERFAKRFQKPIMEHGDLKALDHLRGKVEPFMLRRTKQKVLAELPPKIEQTSRCHLSREQSVLYQQVLARVRGEVFDAVTKKGFQGAQIHILAGLMKLRQACNHPALLVKEKNFRTFSSAKLDMCLELIDEVVEGQRKVLIFSQFTQMLDIVAAALKDRKVRHLYLSGKTRKRQPLIDAFNTDPAFPVFLISLKAGGTGLNLTAADTVVIFDPWWNPSVENQAVDRAHRIGQTKPVNVYRLLTIGTIEEKIQALKQKKQQLFDAVVNESGDLFRKLTWDDVRELFAG